LASYVARSSGREKFASWRALQFPMRSAKKLEAHSIPERRYEDRTSKLEDSKTTFEAHRIFSNIRHGGRTKYFEPKQREDTIRR
jgi:hypothetical protein